MALRMCGNVMHTYLKMQLCSADYLPLQSIFPAQFLLIARMDLITAVFICVFIATVILKSRWRPGGSKSIPGPELSFPILGHLPLLGAEPWITLLQWTKVYGSIFAIKMGIYDVVVLNESKLIKEAFSHPELSGRPPFELFKSPSQGKGLALNDGPLVVEQRTFAHKYLKGFVLRSNLLEENINLELNQVLEGMGRKCGKPVAINGMFSIPVLNAFWNIFMGQRFEHDDPQLRRISQAVAKIAVDDGPLAALSFFVPIISKFLPEFSGLNKKVECFMDIYAYMQKAFDEPLPPTRTFGDPQNFKEAFIDEMDRVGDNPGSSFHPTRNSFQYSAGDIFIGAMELTSKTLDWLLLCMAKHTQVQKKVQAEIDEKIGTTRRPQLSDKGNTPYVVAVIQELLRFSSVAPFGVLHRATEDAKLRGYNINKDTLIIANFYGLNFNQDVWGDPEIFRPERFIDESGTTDRNLMNMMMPFSTGKRSCIGENLARDQLYLYCTGVLQQFNITCDEDLAFESTVGLIRGPKEFTLTFEKRFTE